MEILAPTLLEYGAVRGALPHARTRWAGVHLARWHGTDEGASVIVCGLAGALAPDLPAGTVLVPAWVGLADGRLMPCDPTLVQRLVTAAHALHWQPDTRPLLTAPSLIVGDSRRAWYQQGFVAADMETGLLAERNLRVATIRVVLDSPTHGISPDWLQPMRALLQPQLWPELCWLSCVAPRYALRAAHVLKKALASPLHQPEPAACHQFQAVSPNYWRNHCMKKEYTE
ncbi:MAG: hypothetical protein ACRDHW_13540 [Ktedonobacteraceae bacterium]